MSRLSGLLLRHRHAHQRALETQSLMASPRTGRDEVSSSRLEQLEQHLRACDNCVEAAESIIDVVSELRAGHPDIQASRYLVRATQARLYERGLQLRERQEHTSPLWISCAIAFVWAVISIPLLWEGFAWIGNRGNLMSMVWQSAFVVAWLMPFGLIAALLLGTRGHKAIQH
jgi:hypothetical protein